MCSGYCDTLSQLQDEMFGCYTTGGCINAQCVALISRSAFEGRMQIMG